jgi:hypothetical protein
MRHLVACAVVLGLAGSSLAEILTVDDDGPADFDTIQSAIIVANAGDTVLVSPGTYNRIWANNFVVDLLGKPITVRAAGSPDVTILDGQGLCQNVIACYSGESTGTRIEGFTVTGGSNAGILLNGSCPTIVGCTISGNPEGVRALGSSAHAPEFVDCTIEGNTVAGLYLGLASSLTGCTVRNNTGNYGIFAIDDSLLTDCEIYGNSCAYGGIVCGAAVFTRCVVASNTSLTGTGGGIRINPSSSDPILSQTAVCGNIPNQIDGSYIDGGGNTVAELCPPTGACCTNAECVIALEEDCLTFHGVWHGVGTTCYEQHCAPICTGDTNADGAVDVLDLLQVIAAWGPCP